MGAMPCRLPSGSTTTVACLSQDVMNIVVPITSKVTKIESVFMVHTNSSTYSFSGFSAAACVARQHRKTACQFGSIHRRVAPIFMGGSSLFYRRVLLWASYSLTNAGVRQQTSAGKRLHSGPASG